MPLAWFIWMNIWPTFAEAPITDNMDVTELNEILLNSIPNIWSKQEYV